MAARREKLTKLEKVFFTATAVSGVILLGAPLWWLSLEADPVVHIPAPPPPPKPNAADYYISAGNAIVGTTEITYAVMEPDRPGYKSMFPVRLPNGTTIARPFTPSEKESLLQQNAAALNLLRRGFGYRFQAPPQRSWLTLSPYPPYRQMTSLLVLEGQVKFKRGDWNGAANSYLDAIRFGSDIARGGGATSRRISTMCESMGQRPLWNTINHLNAAQARAAARRLEQISARRAPLSASLTEEKWVGQASLMEIFRGPDWRHHLVSIYGIDNQTGEAAAAAWTRSWLTGKRALMSRYSKIIDASIAAARKPYAPIRSVPPAPQADLMANLTGSFRDLRFSAARIETGSTLLAVALALRAYRLERGAYPAKITELKPRWLKTIPLDPFAANIPLRYKRSGRQYSLYSVGPDGKDNGGKPIVVPGRPASVRYYTADSTGDVVAGADELE